ncbi:MAG: 3-deoxy-manno-octulosonate cytidylyltransferase [Betaproteobacteria bacterium ADurb.Bin341]|nr:MAG: 3-deoxy-manno-octulosonate cytidylyltransferase [Betaproteobacteria bacterium ADurb.Bin341]
MNLVAILQARSSSSRLPGKVLRPILGVPMLLRQIERIQRSRMLHSLVVATSSDASDDALAATCAQNGIACFRGSLDDVLDRFYQAAQSQKATDVVRLTGDCPLADPEVIDKVIQEYLEANVDYAANALEPSYPDGLDVEAFRFAVLERAWRDAHMVSEREHVTPYIYKHPEQFKLLKVCNAENLSHLRWTVDNPEDFEFVSRIYEALYPGKADFTTADILAYLRQHPGLGAVNAHLERNEGYQRSLAKDGSTATDS